MQKVAKQSVERALARQRCNQAKTAREESELKYSQAMAPNLKTDAFVTDDSIAIVAPDDKAQPERDIQKVLSKIHSHTRKRIAAQCQSLTRARLIPDGDFLQQRQNMYERFIDTSGLARLQQHNGVGRTVAPKELRTDLQAIFNRTEMAFNKQ